MIDTAQHITSFFALFVVAVAGCDLAQRPLAPTSNSILNPVLPSNSNSEIEPMTIALSEAQKDGNKPVANGGSGNAAADNNNLFSKEAFLNAALYGKQSEIEDSLRSHADQVNVTDPDGRTALMLACFGGFPEIAKLLLNAGATVDAVDVTERTALMYAASGSNLEVVQLLINHKANLNSVDNVQKWSPLMFAASEGQIKIVKLLLDNGADQSAKDIDGEDCIDFARSRGHADVVWLLKQAKQ